MAKPKNIMAESAVHRLKEFVMPNCGMASKTETQQTASPIKPPRTKIRFFLVSASKIKPPARTEIKQPTGKADDVIAAIPEVNPNVSFR